MVLEITECAVEHTILGSCSCGQIAISVMGGPQAADVLTTVKQDQRARRPSTNAR